MVPILFDGKATNFNTNGIGRLADCISCEVTEERNGIFELVMVYPTTGIHYDDIKLTNFIVVKPNQNQERQAFEIYQITKPINQLVTVYAQHLSYRLSFIPVLPFVADGITNALVGLKGNSVENNPFDFTSDLSNEVSTYNQQIVKSLRSCLGGTEGSLLDTFGGEYEWDNYTVKLWKSRGKDNGVRLRFRKNITDLTQEENLENVITGVLPIWNNIDSNGNIIASFNGDVQYSPYLDLYPIHRTVVLDLTTEYEEAPSLSQLNTAAQRYLEQTSLGIPTKTIKVSFVDLTQTELNSPLLEKVNLCDIVHVYYEPLGIEYDAKVVKTTWDVLRNRYKDIEVGTPKSNIAKTISDNIGDISSLRIANNRLVSVTQSIDYDIGQITSSVSDVNDDLDELSGTVTSHTTQIQQNAENISLSASASVVDAITGRVVDLETHVFVTPYGLKVRQVDNGSYVLIGDNGTGVNGMYIFVDNQLQAYATTNGFNASTFITGNWQIQPMNSGKTLAFF